LREGGQRGGEIKRGRREGGERLVYTSVPSPLPPSSLPLPDPPLNETLTAGDRSLFASN